LIIGTGPERESLEGLVRDLGLAECVHFTGYVVDPYPLVARSRVFVLSSLIEGFPTAIVEALVLGVPVVSTDCLSGPREILDNGRFGRLVPIADSKALADAVLNTLLNGDIINTNDLRSRAEDFTEEHVVAEYAQLLGVLSRDK
jgi:glycosyltransferase involved in cell wall biosynthesis